MHFYWKISYFGNFLVFIHRPMPTRGGQDFIRGAGPPLAPRRLRPCLEQLVFKLHVINNIQLTIGAALNLATLLNTGSTSYLHCPYLSLKPCSTCIVQLSRLSIQYWFATSPRHFYTVLNQ